MAKSDFRPGYVITRAGDTLNGELARRINTPNYKTCRFKYQGEVTVYKPADIEVFAYHGGKKFTSQILDTAFAEVLIEGELSLYRYADDAYALKKKGEELRLLYIVPTEHREGPNGWGKWFDDKSWTGKVLYLIQDCLPDNYQQKVSTLPLTKRALTKLVIEYHACRGLEYELIKKKKPLISKVRIGGLVSARYTHLRFKERSFSRDRLTSNMHRVTPSFGLMLNLSSPRISERFSVQVEPQFFTLNYAIDHSFTNLSQRSDTEVSLSYSIISVPLTLSYDVIGGIYVQAGVNFEFYPRATGHFKRTTTFRTQPDRPFTDVDREIASFMKSSGFDWIVGVGAKRYFSRYLFDLSLRYYLKTTELFEGIQTDLIEGKWYQIGLTLSVSPDFAKPK